MAVEAGAGHGWIPSASASTSTKSRKTGNRVYILTTTGKLASGDEDLTQTDIYVREGSATTLLARPRESPIRIPPSVDLLGASADGSRVFFTTSRKWSPRTTTTTRDDTYMRSAGVTSLLTAPEPASRGPAEQQRQPMPGWRPTGSELSS